MGRGGRLSRGAHASLSLIKGLGYPIYPSAKKLIDAKPVVVFATTLRSMSRIASPCEVLATGEAERQLRHYRRPSGVARPAPAA